MSNERSWPHVPALHVLIVEDEDWIRELWNVELTDADDRYRVTAVASGEAALPVLAAGGVDAAIIDIGLPAMSGETLIGLARDIDPLLPILVVTGFDAAHYQHLWAHGIRVLQKPFRTSWLLLNLRALLRRRSGLDACADYATLVAAC